MPTIYRHRSQSPSDRESDVENIAPVRNDPEDSMVLSDLVRTGEASRLRRRGAMRLDHGYNRQTIQLQPAVIVIDSPWDSEPEDIQAGPMYARERFRSTRGGRHRRVAEEEELSYTYTILCGAEESDSVLEFSSQPHAQYEQSVLPLYPPSSSGAPSFPTRKKSNGCGAILHMSAAPRQRNGTWLAKDDSTSAVISMDAKYFDKETASKIVSNGCGCFREGIGCSVCGNPIGTRYRGCKTSGGVTHTHRKPSISGPIQPEGIRYWRAQNHQHGDESFAYTFFSSAVTSYPSYSFTVQPNPHELPPPALAQDSLADRAPDEYDTDSLPPIYNNNIFDRVITASPTPLSDLGEDDRENLYQDGFGTSTIPPPPTAQVLHSGNWAEPVYDLDGEYVLTGEPGSPDKTNDLMLFPER